MTNQEQYEIIWDKANKYDKLIKALDDIKDEIKRLTSRYTISRERGGMGQVEWSDRLIKESDVLDIIDKYRTESEDDKEISCELSHEELDKFKLEYGGITPCSEYRFCELCPWGKDGKRGIV